MSTCAGFAFQKAWCVAVSGHGITDAGDTLLIFFAQAWGIVVTLFVSYRLEPLVREAEKVT